MGVASYTYQNLPIRTKLRFLSVGFISHNDVSVVAKAVEGLLQNSSKTFSSIERCTADSFFNCKSI